jgi:hypothetical protein
MLFPIVQHDNTLVPNSLVWHPALSIAAVGFLVSLAYLQANLPHVPLTKEYLSRLHRFRNKSDKWSFDKVIDELICEGYISGTNIDGLEVIRLNN